MIDIARDPRTTPVIVSAVRTPIEIGQRSATEAEVLNGLAPGVPVIAFPGDDIADGVAVEPRAGQPGA